MEGFLAAFAPMLAGIANDPAKLAELAYTADPAPMLAATGGATSFMNPPAPPFASNIGAFGNMLTPGAPGTMPGMSGTAPPVPPAPAGAAPLGLNQVQALQAMMRNPQHIPPTAGVGRAPSQVQMTPVAPAMAPAARRPLTLAELMHGVGR